MVQSHELITLEQNLELVSKRTTTYFRWYMAYFNLASMKNVNVIREDTKLINNEITHNPQRVLEAQAEEKVSAIHLTDLGNAEKFEQDHGEKIRYITTHEVFITWADSHWKIDTDGEVQRLAQATVRSLYAEAAECPDLEKRRSIADWAKKSEADQRLNAMVKRLKVQKSIPISQEEMDANPCLINLPNGTLVVDRVNKKFDFREHDREDLCTKMTKAPYRAEADCPKWKAFLELILPDAATRGYVQKALGRCLMGGSERRPLLICHGRGKNGKTTLLETINVLLGDYATVTPTETLVARREGTVPSDIARLERTRLVYTSELEKSQPLSEGMLKRLLSGGEITARYLYKDLFTFKPECGIFIDTNNKPDIRGTDDGTWDRIVLIPFLVSLPEVLSADQLKPNDIAIAELLEEMDGILNWLLKGLMDYLHDGWSLPEALEATHSEYRRDSDRFSEFLEDCCVVDATAKVPVKNMYDTYWSWCMANGGDRLTMNAFKADMQEHGFKSTVAKINKVAARVWMGIDLSQSM